MGRFWLVSEPQLKIAGENFLLSFKTEDMPPAELGYKGVPPTPAQIAAHEYLKENDETVRNAVLQYMFEHYPQWQEDYGDEEYMPDVTEVKQFQSLVTLWSIDILSEEKNGVAYLYLGLQINWDPEHGMAAIVHKNRVIAVGDHDSMWNVAEQDAGQ